MALQLELQAKTGEAMKVSLLLALYGGPDQLMPLTSGLTAVFAFLLIFWNKVLVMVGKLVSLFRGRHQPPPAESPAKPSQETIERSQSEIHQ
jgi:Na+-transporting methylmalonyl-CoA/oxaloacetate decarboxylase gamma subunit